MGFKNWRARQIVLEGNRQLVGLRVRALLGLVFRCLVFDGTMEDEGQEHGFVRFWLTHWILMEMRSKISERAELSIQHEFRREKIAAKRNF